MGFPVPYSELPGFVLHMLLVLGHLRSLVAAAIRLAGLSDLILDDLPFDSSAAAASATLSTPPPPAADPSAIDRALPPAVSYSDLYVSDGGGDGCAVCLHDFEPSSEVRRLANCRHVFHSRCIDSWAYLYRCGGGGGATCPLCRAPLFSSAAGVDDDDIIVAVDDVDYLFDDYSALSFPPAGELAYS